MSKLEITVEVIATEDELISFVTDFLRENVKPVELARDSRNQQALREEVEVADNSKSEAVISPRPSSNTSIPPKTRSVKR